MSILSLNDVRITKSSGTTAFELRIDRLEFDRGARIALVGPSGCGKSTLLDLLALVSIPDTVGSFRATPPCDPGIDLTPLLKRHDLDALGAFRRAHTGYVLQTGGLLPFTTVRRNIALPLQLLGRPQDPAVDEMASLLGIAEHLDKKPAALSAGERQRVAIARALIHRPEFVFADEPTAALDPARSDHVMDLFVSLATDIGSMLIVASHDVDRVGRFGLQPLHHEFIADPRPGVTVARFVQ